MSNNLKVQITADVTELQTKFGVARAETQALQTEFNSLAKASAAGSLDASGIAKFQQLSGALLAARTETAGYARELRDAGFAASGFGSAAAAAAHGAEGLGLNTASAVRYTRELFDEISSGRTRYLPSTLAALANQGLHLSPAMLGAAAGVAALAAGLVYLAYRTTQATDALNQMDLDALRAGNQFGRNMLQGLTDQLAQLPSVSEGAARELVTSLASVHLPFDALQASARIAAETMVQTGQKAEQVGKEISKALSPDTSAVEVAKQYQANLSQADVDAAAAADKAGNSNAILAEKLKLLSAPLNKARTDVNEYNNSWGQAISNALTTIGAVESATSGGQAPATEVINPQTDELKANAAAWQENSAAVQKYTSAVAALPAEKALTFNQNASDGAENQALAAAEQAADIKKQISEQEIDQANQALNQIAADQERAAAQAIASAEQAAAIKHSMAEAEIQDSDRTLRQLVEAEKKADEEMEASRRKLTRNIESAENTMISGLIRGRQSFAQIAEQSAVRLATKEIESAAHAITEKLMLQKAGAVQEKAVSAEVGMKAVMQDAGKAAAGAYSAVAAIPYVGPFLAPAAAATAYAGVMAFEGLASLDVGTNYVPQDMPAYIHKGEAVVPREYNPAAGGSGAGGYSEEHNYNGDVHVHAMDSQSIARMFRRNRGAVASGMVHAFRRGAFNS